MNTAMTALRTFFVAGLCIGAVACVTEADGEDVQWTKDGLKAVAADADVACDQVAVDAADAERAERDGASDADELPKCQDCGCDLLQATIDCRALPGCAGSKASAVSGNTCSVNDCRNSAGCGGTINCILSGVTCGTLPNGDEGVCTFQ